MYLGLYGTLTRIPGSSFRLTNHVLTYSIDLRVHSLCRLHPHASPFQPLPLPHRQAIALPSHHHDRMGYRFWLQRSDSLLRRPSRRTLLLGLRRSSVLPGLSVLPVELVYAKRACIAHGYAVCGKLD